MRHACWLLVIVVPLLLGADSPGTIEFAVQDAATIDEERREVLPAHEAARRFWTDRASR